MQQPVQPSKVITESGFLCPTICSVVESIAIANRSYFFQVYFVYIMCAIVHF